MAGLYFEEFEVGQEFHHEFSRTVTEMDNTMFSLLTMNPQPLHIDAHFAEKTEFGQRLFNSIYTLGIMIGMSVYDTTLGTTIGNLGMTDVKFPKPVFHGDTLKAHTKIIAKRASKSRPIFMTTGDLAASFRAISRARSSAVPWGTTSLSRPTRNAVAASNGSPRNSGPNAWCLPTSRGNCTKWIAGISPTSISG